MTKLTLSEALDILEDGNFHPLAWVTADRDKQTGGKIIRIKAGRIVRHEQNHLHKPAATPERGTERKSQNHSEHATRNIRLENGDIRKMHIYTLFSVNNIPLL